MRSLFLSSLSPQARAELTAKLHAVQAGNCFICEEPIDLHIQANSIDIDHVQASAAGGKDGPENFALAHSHCNRSKQASDLRVARVLARFDKVKKVAHEGGKDSPNLGDLLLFHGGAKYEMPVSVLDDGQVTFGFPQLAGDAGTRVRKTDLFHDNLSNMDYFFTGDAPRIFAPR